MRSITIRLIQLVWNGARRATAELNRALAEPGRIETDPLRSGAEESVFQTRKPRARSEG